MKKLSPHKPPASVGDDVWFLASAQANHTAFEPVAL
jgi:hypothetical protein